MKAKALHVIQKTKGNFRSQLLNLKIKAFQPKINFEIEHGEYIVKTAQSKEELEEILKLRYQVFIKEGLGQSKFTGVDFDRYDLIADHIIVKQKITNQIIGTYRLLCSSFTKEFYSQNEFTIQKFLASPGIKLELGRACTHRFFRNGVTLNLIWKGIGEYAKHTKADYLFGCASVKTIDPSMSMVIFQSMKEHHSFEYEIHPTSDYQFERFDFKPGFFTPELIDEKIPSLLKSYIKAGAKIHGYPAVDYDFDCIDFLTVLDLNKISERFKARYF
jgi:putative hemolysin